MKMDSRVLMKVLTLCFCKWSLIVGSQFGSISISIGMEDSKSDDDPTNGLDYKATCPPKTSCVPISSCKLLEDLLDISCFSSDRYFHRLNELSCGHANSEDYVCCPSCECGRVYQDGTEQCGQSMVRGVDYSGIGAHPWVARVGFTHKETGNVRFACSGSIISKRVVLTAAHCALAKPEGYKLSTVVVGEWDISRSPDCNDQFCAPPTQAVKVEHVIVHPGYEQKIFRHDIALIVLKEEIKYSVTAAPICLNDKPEVVLNERATLVGWGKLSGQTNLQGRQQQLQVPLLPLAACERVFGSSVPVGEGQVCAGGEAGRDACSGFGGAPLALERDGSYVQEWRQQQLHAPLLPLAACERVFGSFVPVGEGQVCGPAGRRGGTRARDVCFGGAPLALERDGSYVQMGIVSFGSENCGSEGVPSVYTNIAHYYRWIVENSPS